VTVVVSVPDIPAGDTVITVRGRDVSIDLLRAACILYIVGYWHLVPYTEAFPGYANSITEGIKDTALGTFVFCSGVLLAGRPIALMRVSLVAFYQRRVLRIYPLYAIALLLFGAVGLADRDVILNAMLLLSMFKPPAPYTLWFVSMIMTFYLVTPFLVRLADYPRLYLLASLVIILCAVIIHQETHPLDTRLIQYLPCFLVSIAYKRVVRLEQLIRSRAAVLLALFIPAFYLYQLQYGAGSVAALGRIPAVLIGTLLLFHAAALLAGRCNARAVVWVSYASFCTYLFHRVIFQMSIDLYYPAEGYARLVYLLGVVLPATVVISYYAQLAYDRGAQSLQQRVDLRGRRSRVNHAE
jgi:peptidoglycan/LPS O-acetylase OafA/YrhL